MAKKPIYTVVPAGSGGWHVVDLNGNGRIHGVEIVASCATKAEAEAWVERAEAAALSPAPPKE